MEVIIKGKRIETEKETCLLGVEELLLETLSSGVPEDIEYVIDSLKTVVSERVMSDDILKQEFIKAMSQTNKKVSGE